MGVRRGRGLGDMCVMVRKLVRFFACADVRGDVVVEKQDGITEGVDAMHFFVALRYRWPTQACMCFDYTDEALCAHEDNPRIWAWLVA